MAAAASAVMAITTATTATVAAAITTTASTVHWSQISRSSFTHLDHFSFEIQRFASHRMVKVHGNDIIFNSFNHTNQAVALIIAHRQLVTNLQQTIFDFAIHHEHLFGQIHYSLTDYWAIGIFGIQMESKVISF